MSAFKKLNRQDVFVSEYNAKKQWNFSGSLSNISETSDLEKLFFYKALRSSSIKSEEIFYGSINHLYYSSSLLDGTFTGSYENYRQSTLTFPGSRNLEEEAYILSISKDYCGTHIEPGSFIIKPLTTSSFESYDEDYRREDIVSNDYLKAVIYWNIDKNVYNYVEGELLYNSESYVLEPSPAQEDQYVDQEFEIPDRVEIVDDKEGNLFISGSPDRQVGDIFYSHGIVVLTDSDLLNFYNNYSTVYMDWKSNQPIYTYNAYCKVRDSEMNYTFNSTALSGSNGDIESKLTGSEFAPYMTSIGLYNNAHELIAVAKTGQPVPVSKDTDMTFVVKLDIT